MTEDRARPLAAFALVSMLCAIILGVNLAQGRDADLVATQAAHAQMSKSEVVFGDTLTPRTATQAAAGVSASLAGVGPLSDAVARSSAGSAAGQVSAHAAGHKKAAHKKANHKKAAHKANHKKNAHRNKPKKAKPSLSTIKAALASHLSKGHTSHLVRGHGVKSRGHHVKSVSHVRHVPTTRGGHHTSPFGHGHHWGSWGQNRGHHWNHGWGHRR